jgi:hypothetical protein
VVGEPSSDRREQDSAALAAEQRSCHSNTSCSEGPQQLPLPPQQQPGCADSPAAFPQVSLQLCMQLASVSRRGATPDAPCRGATTSLSQTTCCVCHAA